MRIIKVLFPKAGLFPLSYQTDEQDGYKPGDIVIAPFRNTHITGIVWETDVASDGKILKKIDPEHNKASFSHRLNVGVANLQLIKKTSDYYLAPLGGVTKLVLPVDINSKPLISAEQPELANFTLPELDEKQLEAFEYIKNDKKPCVLKGVTGSGKTEVYFHLVAETLAQGKQVLILLPEISLTNQIVKRFTERFGFKPIIWNSTITKAVKKKILRGILTSKISMVIGARSSLFLPYQNLGLIIVDEEHDHSYKQNDSITYNARDMAVLKCHLSEAKILLVSATPSIETLYNVQLGKYHMVELESRFSGASLPKVTLVDMRKENQQKNNILSATLVGAIKETLVSKNQILLFLNRRGYCPVMLCKPCGYRFECKNCSAALIMHKQENRMKCHHCGYQSKIPDQCPECKQSDNLLLCGYGIEKVQEEIKRLFPEAVTMMLSRDQSGNDDELAKLLTEMENGKIDILIGTQLVTKGYHFPKLGLVGVLEADPSATINDLRAAERTFQLLQQVAGRAGREQDVEGRVFIQTYFPESKILLALLNQDEKGFIEQEMSSREENAMPPFTKMATISVTSKKNEIALLAAKHIVSKAPKGNVKILGPAEASLLKLSGRYRYRILIIAPRRFLLQNYLDLWLNACVIKSTVQVKVDIDPYNFY